MISTKNHICCIGTSVAASPISYDDNKYSMRDTICAHKSPKKSRSGGFLLLLARLEVFRGRVGGDIWGRANTKPWRSVNNEAGPR